MPMGKPGVMLNIKWEPFAPNGGKCGHCGDAMYLKAYALNLSIGLNEKRPLKAILLVCGSCGDALRSQD